MARNQGIKSRNVVRPGYRTGGPNLRAPVKGVSQIGQSMGSHVTERRKELSGVAKSFAPSGAAIGSKLGNQVASETKAGPGGSRSVLPSGFQGTHGSVNPGNPRPITQRHPLDGK